MKREYLSSVEEVLKAEETSASGLSASQASTRLEEHGRNKLREAKKDSLVKRFLMQLKEGDSVTLSSVKVRKNVTTPPERYTDATLLSAMEHAGRFVDDASLKANLGNGLGTPATRADMIEKLVQNRYVERDGKYFVPTAKGREVVRLAPEVLRSPELTGVWEGRLEKISKGKEDPDAFIRDIKKMAADLVKEVERSDKVFSPVFKDSKKCPYCGSEMMKATDPDGSVHYICQRLSCQYEEKEVRVKVETGATAVKKISQIPGEKVKVVLNKKSSVHIPKAVYETKTVVVRESKKAYRHDRNIERERRPQPQRLSSNDFGGGTMADFFRISKERQEKDKNRKRK